MPADVDRRWGWCLQVRFRLRNSELTRDDEPDHGQDDVQVIFHMIWGWLSKGWEPVFKCIQPRNIQNFLRSAKAEKQNLYRFWKPGRSSKKTVCFSERLV